MITIIEKNYNDMIICPNCQGSGKVVEHFSMLPEPKEYDCPLCLGEGRIMQSIKVITRPITDMDKVTFRKVINHSVK